MKYATLLVTMLITGQAFAFGDSESNSAAGAIAGAKAQAGAIAGSRSSVHNRNSNRQNQRQGQHQGQLQGQAQGNIGLGSGNETTINQSYSEDYSEMYDDYTPPAYAPSMGVSAPCKVGISAGGGIPGLSITGGGYVTDEDCVEAETIRMGLQSGNNANASIANKLLHMRLEAAMAERKQDNEEAKVTQILSGEPVVAKTDNNAVWVH